MESSRVSSSEFNNKCSQIDSVAAKPFEVYMNRLSPLLPSDTKGKSLIAKRQGMDLGTIIEPGGAVRDDGIMVVEKHPDGRPKSILGEEKRAKEFIARLPYRPETVSEEPITLPKSLNLDWQWALSPPMELCLAKSALLTFDHELGELGFPRSVALREIRDSIVEMVENEEHTLRFAKHVLGIDYSIALQLRELRSKYLGNEESPFEHLLVVVSNPATKTLDLVFSLFGFEPHKFRLSTCWEGQGAGMIAACGVLRGTRALHCGELPCQVRIGGKTNLRPFYAEEPSSTEVDEARETIRLSRSQAYFDCCFFVENTADEFLLSLISKAHPDREQLELEGLHGFFLDRAMELFGYERMNENKKQTFLGLFDDSLVEPEQPTATGWLRAYRSAIQVMKTKLWPADPLGLDKHQFFSKRMR